MRRVRLGIRARIVGAVVGVVVVTTATLTALRISQTVAQRRAGVRQELAQVSMMLAMASPVVTINGEPDRDDWRRYQETLLRAMQARIEHRDSVFSIAYVAAFDPWGRIRARLANREVLRVLDRHGREVWPVTAAAMAKLLEVLRADDHGLLCVEVQGPGGTLLEIGFSQTRIRDEGREIITRNTAAAILFCLLGGLLGNIVGRRLANPIERLAAAMRQVTAGDLEVEVAVRGDDEVGQLAAAFNAMIEGLRERERIRDRFGRYVSAEVMDKILSDPERVAVAGERREVAVLFADIRGFTSHAERLEADAVVELVNDVFGALWRPVHRWGGTIDKFLGDGVMVIFNAPLDQEDYVRCAAAAALAMCDEVAIVSRARRERGQTAVDVGIGLNVAAVVAGSFGTPERLEYTVVGDGVNVAARLEDMAGPGEVLISQATRDRLGDDAIATDLGWRSLEGKAEPLRVYRLERLAGRE